ncbi:unnamed protein product [Linum trigynum]|uniref:Integrase catalytic domain-containing protein n=1 Tax=Linum trigynum TaxID=586398 RepID=A0AAV2EGN7_9ROSI
MYASQSRQRVMNLKQKLARETQGNRPVAVYLQVMRTTAAELALVQAPVTNEDLILHILRGLREEYDNLSAAVRARDTTIALEDLHDRLVDYEAKLAAIRHRSSSAPTTAFSAGRGRSSPPARGRGSPRRQQMAGPFYYSDSAPRGHSPSRGPPASTALPSASSLLGRPPLLCQFCDKQGHTAKECYRIRGRPQVHHTTTAGYPSSNWLVDTVATNHVTPDLGDLSLYTDYHGPDEVLVGDGSGLLISHIGDSHISTSSACLSLRDMLCVPAIKRRLLSVAQLCKSNPVSVEFFSDCFVVKDLATGAPLLRGQNKDDVHELPAAASPVRLAMTTTKTPSTTWHNRLGHPNHRLLTRLLRTLSLPVSSNSHFHSCVSCALNKSHKLPFSVSTLTSTRPFDLLYMDVWGPSPVVSIDSFSYYLVLVDHFTRYTWLYPLSRKYDVSHVFTTFTKMIANYFHTSIRRVYSDGGGEFQKLCSFFQSTGLTHLLTPPHTPQHNGLAECKHRHVVETGLALLHTANLLLSFWSHAFQTATYLINRLPSSSLRGLTPYFSLFIEHANYLKLRTFGCLCYPWLRPYSPHKLAPRSRPCLFLGYSPTQSAYKCYDPATQRVFVSRHVNFDENSFPGLVDTPPPSYSSPAWLAISTPPIFTYSIPSPPNPTSPPPRSSSPSRQSAGSSRPSTAADAPASPPAMSSRQDCPPPPPGKVAPSRSHSMATRSQHGIFKPKKLFSVQVSSFEVEPTTVQEALADPRWRAAMIEEISALMRNGTWSLVSRPLGPNIVGCRWVFRIKRNADGSIDRFKARLVAKGFTQRPGLDYHDTYSPVLKPVTIRTVFSIALTHGWPIFQFDVNNAFLQGSLQEQIFMAQPPGFRDPAHPKHVCCLSRPLYGLRQAPRSWYMELSTFLQQQGFVCTTSDASLFVYHKNATILYFLVYVDDLLLTGNDSHVLADFQARLAARFSLKRLGAVNYFLGIEVLPSAGGLVLSQHKFIADILHRFRMEDSQPSPTPLSSSASLCLNDGSPPVDATLYKQALGSLQYLLCTRPDIAFAVNKLSQFMHSPSQLHWQSVKRLLRYLKGTMHHGLRLAPVSTPSLVAFADSDWAGDPDDRTSTMGYLLYYGGNLISWKSKKQRSVARSSTEAEYRAVAHATAEMLWVQNLLSELHQPPPHPPVLYSDNLGAVHFSANPVFHSRMKHLALDFHFVRELVQASALHVRHIPTAHQLADSLTKPLPITRFQLLRSKIGVEPASILRGRDKDIK